MNAYARATLLAAALFGALTATARAQCVSLTVSGAQGRTIFSDGLEAGNTAAWTAPAPPAISIAGTDDLLLTLTVAAEPGGDHVVELRFELPGGFLYQSLAVPFSTVVSAGQTQAVRRLPDYPFAVEVRSPGKGARLTAGQLAIDIALPVGGTPIAQTSLTGTWRVWAFLDGIETACLPAAPFNLEP